MEIVLMELVPVYGNSTILTGVYMKASNTVQTAVSCNFSTNNTSVSGVLKIETGQTKSRTVSFTEAQNIRSVTPGALEPNHYLDQIYQLK